MVTFKPISFFKKGIIQEIIKASYHDFILYFPDQKMILYHQWEKEEEETFSNPIISKQTLFTCIDDNPIGYFSWDDQKFPIGQIGQNCILPQYQNQGFGKKQILMMEENFRKLKFDEITVVTGDHDFFKPAQKMYLGCGFNRRRIFNGTLFNKIEFSKTLNI